jgi:YfiH family protein
MSYSLNEFQPREVILENRQRFVRSVAGPELPLAILQQVHSDRVFKASRARFSDPLHGDGWVTGEPELLIAIQTADCLPILLVDTEKRIVAAVHAGWRGTLQRIAAKAASLMQTDFGSHPDNCLAVVGPAIRRCCYEVGEEVLEAFRKEFAGAASFFSRPRDSKATRANSQCIDLAEACRNQLLDVGLADEKIFTDGPCTSCEKERFFSHRADAVGGGRMMSVIAIVASGPPDEFLPAGDG